MVCSCDYRKRAYVVGGRETSKPSDVHKHMMALRKEYNAKENVTVEDIIALHAYQGTHAARASICTNLLGNLSDVGVQHQMGHSDITITRKYYQRFKTSVKEMREKMNNLIQY